MKMVAIHQMYSDDKASEEICQSRLDIGATGIGVRIHPVTMNLIAVFVLFGLCSSAIAKTYKIEGCANDENGKPVTAEVTITRQDRKGNYQVRTGKDGCYRYSGLPGGSYVVAAEPRGLPAPPPQTVLLSQNARVDFRIGLASPSPPPSPSPSSDQIVAVEDQIVAVDDGRFVFRSLRFVRDYLATQLAEHGLPSFVYLAGTVTNETSYPWEGVTFDLQWTDPGGGTGILGTVYCLSFPIGSECSLTLPGRTDPGMMIRSLPQKPYVARFSLTNGYYVPSYRFSLLKPKSSETLAFEDSSIAFAAQVVRQGIVVAIQNKTDQPIKIDWNQVSYIDQTGKANSVSHEGVKYVDAASAKPPSTIPPGARHEDTIVPAGNIQYTDGWKVSLLLPMGAQSRELVGKTISLFMPMEISGKVENYTFAIKIESVN
jgi:Carboxypeptidase regulatory-like domain